eukprot:s3618_g1.t1
MLHSCLANSSGALSAALEEELVTSIPVLAEGGGREALAVEGLELRFGEVSRNSSILDTSGRFALWPGSRLSEESLGPKSPKRSRSAASTGATPRREVPSRPASPRTPRTPRAGSEAALSRFRSELLRRGGTYAAAWRRILDCAGHGYLSFADFCDACRRMTYSGNVKDAWHALDADGSGKVTLCELHWATAEALSRFVASLQSSFGSLEAAARALGRGGRRLRKEEFRSWMQEQQVLSASEADSIFKMICCDSTMSRPSVRAEDIDWLAQLLPHLPLPKGRVAPGASVPDAGTAVDPDAPDLPELGLPEGPADSALPQAARTPRSASQPAPRRPLQDGEDLYERLHREAKDYHARKKEKHEKEGLFRPPGTAQETKACGNTAHLEKLYKMGQMQKRKQEKMADEKKVRDEEVWARLQAKREVREVRSEPEEEKPKEQQNTKYKGPPARPPPSGSASERLYAAARKIESKKKELADRADQETRSKEEELKKKVGPITKAREVEIVQRLHREDQQKREEESMKRKQEKEAQEEEIRRLAVRKQGKVRPETFFRLHLDAGTWTLTFVTSELATFKELADVVAFSSIPADLCALFSKQLGNPPSVRILAMVPASVLQKTILGLRIPSGAPPADGTPTPTRDPNVTETIQMAVVWRVARQAVGLEDMDPMLPGATSSSAVAKAAPAPPVSGTPAAAVTAAAGGAGQSPLKKVKLSNVIDQTDDTEIAVKTRAEMGIYYENHREVTGSDPLPEVEPTDLQVAEDQGRDGDLLRKPQGGYWVRPASGSGAYRPASGGSGRQSGDQGREPIRGLLNPDTFWKEDPARDENQELFVPARWDVALGRHPGPAEFSGLAGMFPGLQIGPFHAALQPYPCSGGRGASECPEGVGDAAAAGGAATLSGEVP